MNYKRCVLAVKETSDQFVSAQKAVSPLELGTVNIRLMKEAYFDLVDMVHTSAADYKATGTECDFA